MKITVQCKSGELAFDCASGEAILHAGLRHGFAFPYECATGTCGTCRARVMRGEVDIGWSNAPGLARLKPDKGDILMCQARAQSDCEIRVPAAIATAEGLAAAGAQRGILEGVRRLTADVAQFEVALSAPMAFEAGQFVVIETPALAGSRAYSMVNFAPQTDRLRLVLKRKPGGGFSNWLFGPAAEGATVKVFGPLGRAVFRVEEGRDLLCIAGGSGIAGMMSILERAVRVDYFRAHRGSVFFGVRTRADCFYLDELARHVTASRGNLHVTVALSHEAADAENHERFPALGLASGFIHEVAAKDLPEVSDNLMAYVAGPPPMVDAALKVLIAQAGLAPPQIRYDKFS